MFHLSFFRTIKFSVQDIFRNIWLSLVTITILILALFTVNILITIDVISRAAIESVKEKIDVNIYLKGETKEEEALALKAQIEGIKDVRAVEYVSRQAALEAFEEKHSKDPEILAALHELGKNPLSPALVIKPADTTRYKDLIAALNAVQNDNIEARNFDDHELVLSKINSITKKVKEAGLFISAIFVLITILLVYNAVRVAIYTHRKEIRIMRLVGASNWFIRMPYVFSGIVYTAIGIGAAMLVFFPFLNLLQPYLATFFVDYNINILAYFQTNSVRIFGAEFAGLAFVNMLASLIAVSKYSKV
jgi:cell division transport system permease protein